MDQGIVKITVFPDSAPLPGSRSCLNKRALFQEKFPIEGNRTECRGAVSWCCIILPESTDLRGQSAEQEEAFMNRIVITVALWLLPVPLCAQWLDFRTRGIPRTVDGKPNLTAPAPRTPDGNPDLSGLWRPELN